MQRNLFCCLLTKAQFFCWASRARLDSGCVPQYGRGSMSLSTSIHEGKQICKTAHWRGILAVHCSICCQTTERFLTSPFLHWWTGYRHTMVRVARTGSLYLVSLVKEPLWSQSVCEVTGSICEGSNAANDVIFPPILLNQTRVQNP